MNKDQWEVQQFLDFTLQPIENYTPYRCTDHGQFLVHQNVNERYCPECGKPARLTTLERYKKRRERVQRLRKLRNYLEG